MMQIIIKTQPYRNNSYCSHLVEHCVFSGHQNIKNFFNIDNETDGISHLCYTSFYIPDHKNADNFIQHISKPLDKQIIKKEKQIISEEIKENGQSTGNKLVNKIGKILYGKDFKRYKNDKISKSEITNYHKSYYKKENLWILDDLFNIVARPKHKTIKQNQQNNENKIIQKKITIEGKQFDNYICNYKSINDCVLCYFLDRLYNTTATYNYRYIGNEYYPPISHFFEYTQHLCFIKRHDVKIELSEKFFEIAKNNFLENPININEIASIHEINKLEIVEKNTIRKIIKEFDYNIIQRYISN